MSFFKRSGCHSTAIAADKTDIARSCDEPRSEGLAGETPRRWPRLGPIGAGLAVDGPVGAPGSEWVIWMRVPHVID